MTLCIITVLSTSALAEGIKYGTKWQLVWVACSFLLSHAKLAVKEIIYLKHNEISMTLPSISTPTTHYFLRWLFASSLVLTRVLNRPVRPSRSWSNTGRTASGIPSFFESVDRLGQIEVELDAIQGPGSALRWFSVTSLPPVFSETSSS